MEIKEQIEEQSQTEIKKEDKKEKKKIDPKERWKAGLVVEKTINEVTQVVSKTLDFFIMVTDKFYKILKLNWALLILGGVTTYFYITDYSRLETFIILLRTFIHGA